MPAAGKQGGQDFYGDTLDVQTANINKDLSVGGTTTHYGPIVAPSVTVVGPNSPNTPTLPGTGGGGVQLAATTTPAGVSTGQLLDYGGAAYNLKAFGALFDGSFDDASAMPAALAKAATTGGEIVIPPLQTVTWKSVPTLAPNTTTPIKISAKGAKITLTATGASFLDFGRVADYDTFQNYELADLFIDAASLNIGRHVVVGVAGVAANFQRLNFSRIAIRRVRTINVVTDATNIRNNVLITTLQPNNAEGTQNTITDIVVEDVDFGGGNVGVAIKGSTNLLTDTGCNVFIDRITVNRWKHTTGGAQAGFVASDHVQIGQQAFGGRCSITNGRGDYSGDVGIETDNMTEAFVSNVEVHNAVNNAFYATNFRPPQYPSAQMVTWENCTAVVDDVAVGFGSGGGKGYRAALGNAGVAHGSYLLKGCRYNKQIANNWTNGSAVLLSGVTLKKVTVEDFTHIEENFDYSSGSAQTIVSGFYVDTLGGTPTIDIKNWYTRVQGTRSGGGALVLITFRITGGTYVLNLERLRFEHSLTGLAAGTIRYMDLGPSTSVFRGKIRAMECVSMSGDTNPTGVRIRGSGTLTITNSLDFYDCDFSQMPAGTEFTVDDNTNKAKTYFWNTKWIVFPKASAAMGAATFAAGTFTTATGNQYIGGSPADIHFATGTGAAITTIAASKDGTTYEEVYTQASGAMAQDVLVPVDNGDFIKVTFATTQPTTRIRFRR